MSTDLPGLAVDATLPQGGGPTEPRPGLEYRELKGRIRSALFGAPADPVRIGRFTVLRRLGKGGMGVVYSAYDDELDRKVAIKLLRPELFGDEGELRLRREAQAVARLSHPNVVSVFESGLHEGRVFVAMEFVQGRTLGAWLREEPHGWAQIVDVFLQAGHGLVAAHAAGLVHRDFKPENVMVSPAGSHGQLRVRVLDFGVARRAVEPDAATGRADAPAALAEAAITVTGAVVGTPAYMAPEQHAGEVADERTDQYSFCLTLWEALFDESPYAATDPRERAREKADGAIRAPSRPSRAPARVRRLLQRGLSPRREDRHASMEQLLAALAKARGGRRRWVALALVGTIAATSTAAWLGAHDRECASADEKLRGVWDDDRRARVVAALRTSAEAGVGDAWLRLEPALDDYAAAWRAAYVRACEDDARSEELGLQERLCLAAQLRELDELVDAAAAGDAAAVKTAAATTGGRDPPGSCHDEEFLRAWAELEAQRNAAAPKGSELGLVSDFEGEPWARFGAGWIDSVDTLAGGESEVTVEIALGGNGGTGHAMRLVGEVRQRGRGFGWAGAMFMAGDQPMAPANLSDKQRITFAARGEAGTYAVMLFSQSRGWEPGVVRFEVGPAWTPVEIPMNAFDVPRFDVTAVFFGRVDDGRFELLLDDVRIE